MAFLDDEKLEQSENEEVVVEESQQTPSNEEPEEEIVEIKEAKTQKGKATTKSKKPSKIKSTFGELKNVSWTPFKKTLKQTAVVLSVTLIFLVVIMGIDQLLYFLVNLIQP